MKRALVVTTGTIAGVAAVLALNPDAATSTTATATKTSTSSSSTGSSTTNGATTGSAPSAAAGSTATAQTYTGPSVDVGRGYGSVQLEVTVTDGRIVDITALALPDNDHKSAQISNQAFPYLVEEAIAAQSADIAGISGASYTSYGFVESLRAALVEAGLA